MLVEVTVNGWIVFLIALVVFTLILLMRGDGGGDGEKDDRDWWKESHHFNSDDYPEGSNGTRM